MFKRPRHMLVQRILDAFDARFLSETCCYFGGGTRIVMELDEYRESLDIDLLCADKDGYRAIRSSSWRTLVSEMQSRVLILLGKFTASPWDCSRSFQCKQ